MAGARQERSSMKTNNLKSVQAEAVSLISEANKRVATAVLGKQKCHSHRLLALRFQHDGFDYRQIERVGDIAIYEQALQGRVLAYEVIRIRRHDGFTIRGKFMEPAEIYPRSDAWGIDAWTVLDKETAFRKLKGIK